MGFFGHLQCQAMTYVASQSHIIASSLEDVVYEACGCGLAVGTGDADHLGVGVSSSKFYLTDNGDVCLAHLLYHGRCVRYTRTLYYLISIKDKFFSVMTFFPFDAMLNEHLFVVCLDFASVRDKDIKTFLLCENCCTYTALGGT